MGFTLDQNTIRELAATIASEVVKAISEARLVKDSHAITAAIDGPEVMYVGRSPSTSVVAKLRRAAASWT